MKKYTASLLVYILFTLTACNKTSENDILLRIENNTSQDFKEVLTNNKNFTHVEASAITSYQHFDQIVDLPYARLITDNNDTAYAGLIYYDPPVPYLTSGKYTLKIVEDTSTYYGYNCAYIKN